MPGSVARPRRIRLALGCLVALGVANLVRWVGWQQQTPALETLSLPFAPAAPLLMAAMWAGVWSGLAMFLWSERVLRWPLIPLVVLLYAISRLLGLALWGQPRPWWGWGMQLAWYSALMLFFVWALPAASSHSTNAQARSGDGEERALTRQDTTT